MSSLVGWLVGRVVFVFCFCSLLCFGAVALSPSPKRVDKNGSVVPVTAFRACTVLLAQFFDAWNPALKTKRRAAFVKEMMRGAASALAFMHEAGVVHRSLGAPSLRVNTLGEGINGKS